MGQATLFIQWIWLFKYVQTFLSKLQHFTDTVLSLLTFQVRGNRFRSNLLRTKVVMSSPRLLKRWGTIHGSCFLSGILHWCDKINSNLVSAFHWANAQQRQSCRFYVFCGHELHEWLITLASSWDDRRLIVCWCYSLRKFRRWRRW